MQFDTQLLFWHTGSAFAFTAGEFVSLVGVTSSGTASTAINLQNARDLGVGSGMANPGLAICIGTGITSASTGLNLNFQFQGSTDSTNWTTYAESGALTTASFLGGTLVFPIDIPPRVAPGVALPQYYRLNLAATGVTSQTISAGTILAGIVLSRDLLPGGSLYPSNFTAV